MSFDTLKSKEIVARKRHTCFWCGEEIAPGDIAQYEAGLTDGDFWSGYLHPECHQAMDDTDFDEYPDGFAEHEFLRGIPG